MLNDDARSLLGRLYIHDFVPLHQPTSSDMSRLCARLFVLGRLHRDRLRPALTTPARLRRRCAPTTSTTTTSRAAPPSSDHVDHDHVPSGSADLRPRRPRTTSTTSRVAPPSSDHVDHRPRQPRPEWLRRVPTTSTTRPRRNDDRREERRYDNRDHRHDDRLENSRTGQLHRHRPDFYPKISTLLIFIFNTIFITMFLHKRPRHNYSSKNVCPCIPS